MDISETKENKLNLFLGDIIRIISPNNSKYDNKIYFIEYLDNEIIKIVNSDEIDILHLGENGELSDYSIKEIHVLKRQVSQSYAKQHHLEIDTWIDIKFGGDLPFMITGLITNIIEDMIEIQLYPGKETIFIDFSYKGIPKDMDIEHIQIRDAPKSAEEEKIRSETTINTKIHGDVEKNEEIEDSEDSKEGDESDENDENEESVDDEDRDSDLSKASPPSKKSETIGEDIVEDDIIPNDIPYENMKNTENTFIDETDYVDEGEILGAVTQYVNVVDSRKRFSLEEQKEDMINKYFDSIPPFQQKKLHKEEIQILVQRFDELRGLFTSFDENDYPIKAIRRGRDYHPLYNHFIDGNSNFRNVIVPISSIQKSIYDVNITNDTVNNVEFTNVMSNDVLFDHNFNNKLINYSEFMNYTDESLTPYIRPSQKEYFYPMKVSQDISAIVDNDEMYNTITVKGVNDSVSSATTKYFDQKYVSNMTYAERDIMAKETMDIKSLITLPYSYSTLSKPYLYEDSILEKVYHSSYGSRQFKLFDKNLHLHTNIVKLNKDKKMENDENYSNVFVEPTEHLFDDDIILSKQVYQSYFQRILPDRNDVVDFIMNSKHALSVHEYIKFMETYAIDHSELHFYHYKKLLDGVYKNVNNFWKQYKNYGKQINILNRKLSEIVSVTPTLTKLLGENDFEQMYLKSNDNFLSNSEIMYYMMNHDNSRLFIEVQKKLSRDIINSTEINMKQLLDQYSPGEENITSNSKDVNQCKKFNISKKYDSLEALTKDNDKSIYYDKQYDDIVYDVLDVYKKEKNTMEQGEFAVFLQNKLVEVNGIKDEEAKDIALSMIAGKKVVRDGDYAVLQNVSEDFENSSVEFYRRVENKWVFDDAATKSQTSNAIQVKPQLCGPINCTERVSQSKSLALNLKDKNVPQDVANNMITDIPIQKKFDCVSTEGKKSEVKQRLLRDMIEEYKHRYAKDGEDMEENLEFLLRTSKELTTLHNTERLKYQTYANMLGERVTERNTIASPHLKKWNQILQIDHLFQRQQEILEYIHKYTRSSIFPESKYYYYCKTTNVKLIPTFYFDIAKVVVQNKNTFDNTAYAETIRMLYRQRGTESDDGGYIIDKHSGEVIAPIDFDSNEGYDEQGKKIASRSEITEVTREIPEEEDNVIDAIEDIGLSNHLSNEVYIDEQGTMKLTHLNVKEFILQIVHYMSNELNIDITLQKEFMLFKTIHIFEKRRNNKNEEYTLALLTLCMFFVTIQLYYPNITGRYMKVNDCKASFKGFPLEDDNDYSGIEFFACLVAKRKKKISRKFKDADEDKIKQHMITIISSFIMNEIQSEIDEIRAQTEKKEHLLKFFIEKNLTFHPPLQRFKIHGSALQNHLSDIKSSIKKQAKVLPSLNAIAAKNIIFSYAFIQEVNDNIRNTDLHLQNHTTNEFYLENSCCMVNSVTNIVDYLSEKERNIERYIRIVEENEKYLTSLHTLPTRYVSKEISKDRNFNLDKKFGNKTIEQFFDKYGSADLEEKYQERNYKGMVERLNDIYSIYDKFSIQSASSLSISKHLLQVFSKVNSYLDDDIMKQCQNYLETTDEVEDMKTIVLKKIELENALNNKIQDMRTQYKSKISDRKESIGITFIHNHDIQHLKNSIYKYCFLFPSFVYHNLSTSDFNKLPRHWRLSENHYIDINRHFTEYYKFLEKFTKNESSQNVCMRLLHQYKQYEYIIRELSHIPVKNNHRELALDNGIIEKILHCIVLEIFVSVERSVTDGNEKKQLRTLVESYDDNLKLNRKMFDFSLDTMKKRTLKSQEREKDKITKVLKNKSDQERQVSNVLKKLKIGEWSIGEQKGLRIYDKNFRDENRPEGDDFYFQQDTANELSEYLGSEDD